jgi:ABC-type branched-subunit amino acid transport system substrate-binding protein
VFSLLNYWNRQAAILPSFIKNVLSGSGKRIGVVYESSGTAKNAKDTFLRSAGQAGLEIVSEQPVERNQSTCANQVANLQSARAEIVFLLTGPLGGICMLRDSRALGYRPTFTGIGGTWNVNLVARASGGAADGVRTLSIQTTLETPAGRHYSELMRSRGIGGADEDDALMSLYSLARTYIEAVRRTGPNLTRQAFVRTFETQMSGYQSGYLPPPTFGPGNRTGPTAVGVTKCCTNEKFTTERPGWHEGF